MSQRGARKTWSNRKTSMCWTNIGSIGSKLGSIRGFAGSARGLSLPCQGSIGGPFIRILLVTKIGELIWTALQIETWCQYPINLIDSHWTLKQTLRNLLEMTLGLNLESYPNQHSNLITSRLLTDSWLTPNFKRLALNPTTDSKKFVGDETRSQFGELSKSALQIWRAFQISSPIWFPSDSWLTPDWLPTSKTCFKANNRL